jgi:hypothetical protein
MLCEHARQMKEKSKAMSELSNNLDKITMDNEKLK